MSYVITTTSGNVLLTLQDGTTDSSTGMVLIGKNYTSYGVLQNDNFVRLAENFASALPPNQTVGTAVLTGTQWYDTANRLIKVYDGTNFNPVSGRIQSNVAPTARNVGDQWWDTGNLQLNSWNGSTWQLIGPAYSATQSISGPSVATVVDQVAGSHTIVKGYVGGSLVTVESNAAFTPNVALAGFPTIGAGLNVSNNYSLFANTAAVTNNITIGKTATANLVVANYAAVTNLTVTNLTTGAMQSAGVYDNGNRVVSNVSINPGPGIGITGQVTGGPIAAATIVNTGVLSLSAGSGINLSGTTGAVQITNGGVTSAIPGTGVHLSNTTGAVQFNIGQAVDVTQTPLFNGMNSSGPIIPTANISLSLGNPTGWWNNIYSVNYTGTNFNGTIFNGTTYNGTTLNVPNVNGTTYTGTTYTGTTFNSTTYNGTTYNGTAFVGSNFGQAGAVYTGATYNGVDYYGTTFHGTALVANYADLAENYVADKKYIPGTVVVFGGDKEITMSLGFADVSVAGVISTNPAYLMNDGLVDGLPVALRGRVPVLVAGTVKKGDLLVTSGTAGCACSVGKDKSHGVAIFAKALEDKTTVDIGTIEAVII